MNARTLLIALVLMSGCAARGPVLDTGNAPPGVGGTIAGTVSASDGAAALSARRVTAIDTSTGARFDVSTASNGGYTVKVPAGTYRLEVELRTGERVATGPDSTQVNVGDVDAGRNFVIGR
jgi:uncharacterized protein YceK